MNVEGWEKQGPWTKLFTKKPQTGEGSLGFSYSFVAVIWAMGFFANPDVSVEAASVLMKMIMILSLMGIVTALIDLDFKTSGWFGKGTVAYLSIAATYVIISLYVVDASAVTSLVLLGKLSTFAVLVSVLFVAANKK